MMLVMATNGGGSTGKERDRAAFACMHAFSQVKLTTVHVETVGFPGTRIHAQHCCNPLVNHFDSGKKPKWVKQKRCDEVSAMRNLLCEVMSGRALDGSLRRLHSGGGAKRHQRCDRVVLRKSYAVVFRQRFGGAHYRGEKLRYSYFVKDFMECEYPDLLITQTLKE
ncbi:hypothetical protein BHM03_00024488 [Ensete ventricosum]|nr:hypothetical protein BHM03_00024488 [Ensete ventricosum]